MEDTIQLSAKDKNELSLRVARFQAYQQLAQVEQMEIHAYVTAQHGINLQENWSLDIEKGLLTRSESTAPRSSYDEQGVLSRVSDAEQQPAKQPE